MILNTYSHAHAFAPRAALGKFLGAVVLGASALIAPAHADVINFEGGYDQIGYLTHNQYVPSGRFNVLGLSITDGAITGDLVGAFIDGTDPDACISLSCPKNNKSTYLAALDDSFIDIQRADGGSFRLAAFDAAFLGPLSNLVNGGYVAITGVRTNDTQFTEIFGLGSSGIDGYSFKHFNVSSTFANTNLVEAYFYGYGCTSGSCVAVTNNSAQFGLDNITFVPEPSSQLLFGLGLIAMFAAARRRFL